VAAPHSASFLPSRRNYCTNNRLSVNVFYRINQDPPSPHTAHDIERTRQEREFKIGSVGFADSSGILFASILAVPMEVALCRRQVARGKLLCKGL
jgi:battenin